MTNSRRLQLLGRLLLVFIAVCALYYLAITGTGALPPTPAGRQWHLVFNDEFDGDKLDTNHWTTCYHWYDKVYQGCSNSSNNERQWYMASQVEVHGGIATLTAEAKPVKGRSETNQQDTYPYISGMLSTGRPEVDAAPKWTGTYGYYEARLKVSAGKGLWPAFWLLPADYTWPPEVDIMEMVGDKPNQVFMTYHWGEDPAKHQEDSSSYAADDFTRGWHTYAINWQPGRIDWYVDGRSRKSITGKNITDKPMAILLNLAVGGDFPGNPNSLTRFPAYMQIDYVRVYSF